MTVDPELTPDRDTRIDGTGDIAIRTGAANTRQQHANACFRAGERLEHELATPEALEDFRIAVRDEITSIPAVQALWSLTVDTPDRRTVAVDVFTDALATPLQREVDL